MCYLSKRTPKERKASTEHFHSALLAASEKLGWPMAVNYAKVASEDRTTFETAFRNLLKLQSLFVFSLSAYICKLKKTEERR